MGGRAGWGEGTGIPFTENGGAGIPFTENAERDILHREAKIFILGILMYPGYPNGHDE